MSDIRWIQRLENLEKANALVQEVVINNPANTLSELEKQGLIQREENRHHRYFVALCLACQTIQ
ncbi:MAG: hypothetical protein IKP73_14955 [Bacteroidales bacterium]|nr:hypothetical protein [Bacteroidales bacterium]